jgi:polyferredoxin
MDYTVVINQENSMSKMMMTTTKLFLFVVVIAATVTFSSVSVYAHSNPNEPINIFTVYGQSKTKQLYLE